MQRLLSIALSCLFAVSLSAQTEYPYPYNPDGNNDGLISIQDLMSLLSIYGEEYSAGVLATDSISAIYYTGELDYWDCTSSCVALTGNWKVLDHLLIGSYKTEIQEAPSSAVWQDHMTRMYDDHDPPALSTNSFSPTTAYVLNERSCFCQTRSHPSIEENYLIEDGGDECGGCTTSIESFGVMDYWDCAMTCKNLSPNSKIIDYLNVGEHKNELTDVLENSPNMVWMDHKEGPIMRSGGQGYVWVPIVHIPNADDEWNISASLPKNPAICVCQTPN